MATEEGQNATARRSILRTPGQPPRNTAATIQFHNDRHDYIIKVYSWAGAFVGISLFQWVGICMDHGLRNYFKDNTFISFIAAFSTLVLLTLFALFNDLRFNLSINWIFALCVVECATFGLLQTILYCSLIILMLCFLGTICLIAGLSGIGIMLPLDMTEFIVPILAFSFVTYLLITFVMLFSITAGVYFPKWLFYSVVILLLVVYTMYNAQLISGTRAGVLRWRDFILPALMVYFTFVVMFTLLASLSMDDPKFHFNYEYKLRGNWPFD